MTEAQAKDFFAVFYGGEHHFHGPLKTDGPGCFHIHHHGDLASFDYDELTRLVLMAHERRVRVRIGAGGPRGLRISITARRSDTFSMSLDHPSIEEAIEHFRSADCPGEPSRWGRRWAEKNEAAYRRVEEEVGRGS